MLRCVGLVFLVFVISLASSDILTCTSAQVIDVVSSGSSLTNQTVQKDEMKCFQFEIPDKAQNVNITIKRTGGGDLGGLYVKYEGFPADGCDCPEVRYPDC